MNDTIENCTKELLTAIKSSEEYRKFEEKKKEIREYPEFKVQIDEFRKRVYLLQNSDSSIDLLEEMSRLLQERQELYQNPLIFEYLTSELNLCRILQRISMAILNVTDMEIDSFEDVISL